MAAKEAKAANMNVRDGLKKIGAAFLSTREVSSQECVYRCMPELWLRKIFPAAVFVSTDLPDKRVRIAKSQQELDELDDESTDVYKSNIIERYTRRPQSIPSVNNLCPSRVLQLTITRIIKKNAKKLLMLSLKCLLTI